MERLYSAIADAAGRALSPAAASALPSRAALGRLHRLARCATLLWIAAVATPAGAHPLSLQECLEGGDFIAHAAEARGNGMTKAVFNDKLLADIYLVEAFPPQLRWFVQDPEDAEFLLSEATLVFDRPQAPEAHRTDFLSRCFERELGTGSAPPSGATETPGFMPAEPHSSGHP